MNKAKRCHFFHRNPTPVSSLLSLNFNVHHYTSVRYEWPSHPCMLFTPGHYCCFHLTWLLCHLQGASDPFETPPPVPQDRARTSPHPHSVFFFLWLWMLTSQFNWSLSTTLTLRLTLGLSFVFEFEFGFEFEVEFELNSDSDFLSCV